MTREKITDTSRHQPPASVWSGWKDERPSAANPIFGRGGYTREDAWKSYVARVFGSGQHE